MSHDYDTADELVPPVCRPTVARLQSVLDGELEAAALDADPHPAACRACRDRIAGARMVLEVLATYEPVAAPVGLTDRILGAVKEDGYARLRRRSYAGAIAAVATLAASLLLVGWLTRTPGEPIVLLPVSPEIAKSASPLAAPEPRPAPDRPTLRIGDEWAKAGVALRGAPRTITDPATAAPDVFAKLTNALTRPMAPVVGMMGDMDPARAALAELPDVARTSLEPLTGTAEKAFARLLRDVGSVGTKPKS